MLYVSNEELKNKQLKKLRDKIFYEYYENTMLVY